MRDQIPTRAVTLRWIMRQPTFALGVADARAARPLRENVDWDTDAAWNYERGRVFGTLAPRSIVFKVSGQVTTQALAWGQRHNAILL
jgi:hypothetical protein